MTDQLSEFFGVR